MAEVLFLVWRLSEPAQRSQPTPSSMEQMALPSGLEKGKETAGWCYVGFCSRSQAFFVPRLACKALGSATKPCEERETNSGAS
jgi:hypothetical protein